jgi:hypothetical protein
MGFKIVQESWNHERGHDPRRGDGVDHVAAWDNRLFEEGMVGNL